MSFLQDKHFTDKINMSTGPDSKVQWVGWEMTFIQDKHFTDKKTCLQVQTVRSVGWVGDEFHSG